MKFTIFGGRGFVGSNLKDYLELQGHHVEIPPRGTEKELVTSGQELGHVIYAIGLTADFRQRPVATIEAHVHMLTDLLYEAKFDSWLYLSSTRVYAELNEHERADETVKLPVTPSADTLYNLSKLLGESVCLGRENPTIRVARLSNVYGKGQESVTFLGAVMNELLTKGRVEIREAPLSSKDYISIEDVCVLLAKIALGGKEQIYNIACGTPTSHQEIADQLTKLTNNPVTFAKNGQRRSFPVIDATRIINEFAIQPKSLITQLASLLPEKQ